MSSHDLEKPSLAAMPASDRVLFLLKTRGPQTAAELAVALRITGEAVRQQLLRLSEEGLVSATAEAHGIGRPSQVYGLTPAAQKRFPDTHAELTVQIIDSIKDVLGERALDKLLQARASESLARYGEALRRQPSLEKKIKKLAELRAAEGYMAIWQREGDGYLLIENHCPICAAATACLGFCRSEIEIFRKVLGSKVEVERTEHLLAGARRCAYRITRYS
ncbi:MAG: metalloregulator ArsR/SmtB family transcription factor [Chthoniobacterales bacterium]